jgi:hypothetical protein
MRRLPVMHGTIARRILANYQVHPDVLSRFLPPPFRPKTIHGVGIAGICLIRLQGMKPLMAGGPLGFGSENAAHRIAVEWTTADGIDREGVYIPRRDTSSRLNTIVGGRVFPGVHQHAYFQVDEHDDHFRVELNSDDRQTHVLVEGRLSAQLPPTSVFQSLAEASQFFEAGSLGYSANRRAGEYDGLELRSVQWNVEPLVVERIESSFFENEEVFPKGSLQFDCALIMRGIQHEWHSQETLSCTPVV